MEIEISGKFPESMLKDEGGLEICLKFEYEWKSIKCKNCFKLDNESNRCEVKF